MNHIYYIIQDANSSTFYEGADLEEVKRIRDESINCHVINVARDSCYVSVYDVHIVRDNVKSEWKRFENRAKIPVESELGKILIKGLKL